MAAARAVELSAALQIVEESCCESEEEPRGRLALVPEARNGRCSRRTKVLAAVLASLALASALAAVVARRPRASEAAAAAVESKAVLAAEAAGGCRKPSPEERCYKAVEYGRIAGVLGHPQWYPGLTQSSSFEAFQWHLHSVHSADCPPPCGYRPSCLCLFDVDRTLTGKQELMAQCPGNSVQQGVVDTAFTGGALTLSALGQAVRNTFCGQCHTGVVSAGSAGGPAMKRVLEAHLSGGDGGAPGFWSGPGDIRSQYVIGCPNPQKANCAKGIVDWFASSKGVVIPPKEVYFFDDLTGNTAGFAAQGFNARQVSCRSREGPIGLCGAQPSEIVRAPGVFNC